MVNFAGQTQVHPGEIVKPYLHSIVTSQTLRLSRLFKSLRYSTLEYIAASARSQARQRRYIRLEKTRKSRWDMNLRDRKNVCSQAKNPSEFTEL